MAQDDLFKALSMFKTGVQELQQSRVIAGANDTVQKIRSSEMDEAQKRAQLYNVSNDLVAGLSMSGAELGKVQQVAQAFAPKQFANANQMNIEAQLSGNESLAQEAVKQREFETNPRFELAKLQAARSPIDDAFKAQKFQEMNDQFTEKQMSRIFKEANPATSVRNNMGVLQKTLSRIQEAETLAAHPESITIQQLEELPKVMDSILTGGTSTVSGVEHLRPNTAAQKMAKMREMITSNPQVVKTPEFVNMYADSIDRMKQVAVSQLKSHIKGTLKATGAGMAARDAEQFKTRAESLMNQYGGDNIVSIDPKSKKIVFESDQKEEELANVLKAVIANPNHPQAAAALQKASDSPYYLGVMSSHPSLNNKLRSLRSKMGHK